MAIFPSLASRIVDTSLPTYDWLPRMDWPPRATFPMMASHLVAFNSSRCAWLPRMDSNHDKQIQNLQCYRYTTRQRIGHNRSVSRNIQLRISGNKIRESHIRLGPPAFLG